MSQIPALLAIITATSSPTKLVSTLPRNIRQAARRRGRRRSKTANSTDFTTTATASTRIDPERARAGTMTSMNGTTGSHAKAGLATISGTASARKRRSLCMLVASPAQLNVSWHLSCYQHLSERSSERVLQRFVCEETRLLLHVLIRYARGYTPSTADLPSFQSYSAAAAARQVCATLGRASVCGRAIFQLEFAFEQR